MSDVLVLSQSEQEGAALLKSAEVKGLAPKYTAELKNALAWLKLRKYDALLVHSQIAIEVQQQLGNLLWGRNPTAQMIVYESATNSEDRDGNSSSPVSPSSFKLYGAEYVKRGEDPFQGLETLANENTKESGAKVEDFRIMVVEDLDSPRDIICFFIESLGFPKAEGFNSAKAAMAALEADPTGFDCVVTDIRMPEITGKELIETVRQHDKLRHLPIIVLTAYGTVDCLVDCLKAGASGFLVKPPKKDDLLRELARAQRIAARQISPRLINHDEADTIREILIDRGFS